MSVYLFTTIFLFLSCSTFSFAVAYYAVNPQSAATATETQIDFFKDDCFKTPKLSGSGVKEINKFGNVFFVTTEKMLVAVAETLYTSSSGNKKTIDLVSASIETTTGSWVEEIFKKNADDNCGGWKKQMATTERVDSEVFSTVKNVVYDTEKKKIYLLVVNKTSTSGGGGSSQEWKYNIVVGSEDISAGKETTPIKWMPKTSENLKTNGVKDQLKKEDFIESSPTHGGGFVTKDGRVIFVLRNTNENSEKVIVFVELKEDTSKTELNVLHVEKTDNNCYPYLFLWDEKIVMITTNCSLNVNKNVKEFSDIEKWQESSGPFYYLSDFLKDKTSFTTADIGGTNVLLFAKQNEGAGCTDKKCFTFWFSDGNRTYNIGENVVFEKNENVISSSIIFVKEKLYFLHQKSNDKKFTLTRLEKQSQNITETLAKWKNADQSVLKVCGTDTSDFKTICVASLPTEGLVSFLSGKVDTNKWEDKYLYVNAEIKGSATLENGLICNGVGQGAKWPVGKGTENQPYKFTEYGFTLLATINIKENGETVDNSLLGFVLNNDNERFGLWCSNKKKWAVSNKNTVLKDSNLDCQKQKTYIVALVWTNTEFFVYVNWEQVTDLENEMKAIKVRESIKYFYFGAGVDEGETQSIKSHATITNVLLYNRPFTTEQINELKPEQNTVEADRQTSKNENTNKQTSKETTDKTGTQLDTPVTQTTTENEDKQSSSLPPPPTTEDSAARVGVVRVLCTALPLLCASAPLLHL